MSGGNNNITVAVPGEPNWGVWWVNGLGNFQLDIVGFLAVLGEGSVLANAQVSALSRLFYLPRILPAPQALLYTSRPTALPPANAIVSGVESGNVKNKVHHVANILLGKEMEPFTVRCVEVTKTNFRREQRWTDVFFRGQPKRGSSEQHDHEMKAWDKIDRTSSKLSQKELEKRPPLVKAKAFGPLTWVTLIGFFEAIVLFIASIVFGDGMSIVATILLSGLSTVIGAINKCKLKLTQRPNGDTPRGDTVIRYPNGSFLVVRCIEDIARELYFSPESIEYTLKGDWYHRALALLGTLMLMGGIVCLANAKLQLQLAWLGAYVIINIAHWLAAALPQEMHWDLSCYEVREHVIEGGPYNNTFTDALWKAVALTRTAQWVPNNWENSKGTKAWKQWVLDAGAMAKETRSYSANLGDYPKIWNVPNRFEVETWKTPEWNPRQAWEDLHKSCTIIATQAV